MNPNVVLTLPVSDLMDLIDLSLVSYQETSDDNEDSSPRPRPAESGGEFGGDHGAENGGTDRPIKEEEGGGAVEDDNGRDAPDAVSDTIKSRLPQAVPFATMLDTTRPPSMLNSLPSLMHLC